jgi:hypothetical protein
MNLVNELQISAEKDDVLTVLRKTKRMASKLGRIDITDWLNSEQNGYAKDKEVPDYRLVSGTVCMNTNGYVPAGFGRLQKGIIKMPALGILDRNPVRHSISDVLTFIQSRTANNIIARVFEHGSPQDMAIRKCICINSDYSDQVTFALELNSVQIASIPEKIKDKVLDWACDLELAGVTGEGMSFSPEEKAIAHNTTFIIHNSTIDQLNNHGKNQKG